LESNEKPNGHPAIIKRTTGIFKRFLASFTPKSYVHLYFSIFPESSFKACIRSAKLVYFSSNDVLQITWDYQLQILSQFFLTGLAS
jgi:hypothetical protein